MMRAGGGRFHSSRGRSGGAEERLCGRRDGGVREWVVRVMRKCWLRAWYCDVVGAVAVRSGVVHNCWPED
jgi:hypothetical protein